MNYDLWLAQQSHWSIFIFTIQRHWLNAHGISNTVDILSQNYYRHTAIHLSCCFKNVSQLIVNGRKSSWANISISWSFILLVYIAWGKFASFGQSYHFAVSFWWADHQMKIVRYVSIHWGSRGLRKHSLIRIKSFFGSLPILPIFSENLAL